MVHLLKEDIHQQAACIGGPPYTSKSNPNFFMR